MICGNTLASSTVSLLTTIALLCLAAVKKRVPRPAAHTRSRRHSLSMGCFESKPEAEPHEAAALKPRTAQSVPSAAAAPVAAPVPVPRNKPVITDADRAKHKLKNQRDVLERNVRKSEDVLARDLVLARQLHGEGSTESAKVLLRRRRLVKERIKLSVAQLDRVEASLGAVESAENTATVLDAIKAGTAVLARLNASVNVERAEKIMRESEDAMAYTEEVAAVLAGADDAPADDDEDILAELAEFENAEVAGKPAAPAAPAAAVERVDGAVPEKTAAEQGAAQEIADVAVAEPVADEEAGAKSKGKSKQHPSSRQAAPA